MVNYQGSYFPAEQQTQVSSKSFVATWILSFLFGVFGADRFYLGKIGTAVLKLVTLGGLGIWAFVDLVITLCGAQRDKFGRPLEGYQQYRVLAWILTLVPTALSLFLFFALNVFAFVIGTSVPTTPNSGTAIEETSQYAGQNEYQMALNQAQQYSDEYWMSESAIFSVLVDPAEDGFSEEAANYALDNVDADWNENALLVARYLREEEHLSVDEIRDQLLSVEFEAFTIDQVKYAMSHLDVVA
ncbi:Ltp family lipoprotein [Glutamicibacter sp.]|uniref:Ltp family lipoprotein n=1 Tax=Glutamicibacter sp. TaxID=1931995 RepID=UPI0028BD2270|nr:Ltp family lipoprotein [Glutamicibacter sp.]